MAHGAVDNAIAMAELAAKDVAVVIGGDNGFNALFVKPYVEKIEDLKGRIVLVDAPNTAFALVLYKILALHGLARGEYEVKSVGATHLRLAAMKEDRSAAASILNLPFRVLAERAGLRHAGEATSFIGPYLSTAGFVMRRWAKENADLLICYIQAYVEGLRWALEPRNSAAAVELLQRNLKLEPDVALEAFRIAGNGKTGIAKDAEVDLAGLQNVLRLRAEVEGQWGGVAPAAERYLDPSFHRRALAAL